MNYLIYLFYPVLGLVLLKGAKLCRAGEWNEALNYRQMKAIRGFCAICIMFHHMGQINKLHFYILHNYIFLLLKRIKHAYLLNEEILHHN